MSKINSTSTMREPSPQADVQKDVVLKGAMRSITPLKAFADGNKILYNKKNNTFKISTKSIPIIELFKAIINFFSGYRDNPNTVLEGLEKNIKAIKGSTQSIKGDDKALLEGTLEKVKSIALVKFDKRADEQRVQDIKTSIDAILRELHEGQKEAKSVESAKEDEITEKQVEKEEEKEEEPEVAPKTVTVVKEEEVENPPVTETPEKAAAPSKGDKENNAKVANQQGPAASPTPEKKVEKQAPEAKKQVTPAKAPSKQAETPESKLDALQKQYRAKYAEKNQTKDFKKRIVLDKELKQIHREIDKAARAIRHKAK